LHVEALNLALEQGAPFLKDVIAVLMLEPGLYLGARAGGSHIAEAGVEPVATRPALAGGKNLDLLSGLEAIGQRCDAAVDLGAAAAVANLGIHPVGEVDGRGVLGQIDDMAVGGE